MNMLVPDTKADWPSVNKVMQNACSCIGKLDIVGITERLEAAQRLISASLVNKATLQDTLSSNSSATTQTSK